MEISCASGGGCGAGTVQGTGGPAGATLCGDRGGHSSASSRRMILLVRTRIVARSTGIERMIKKAAGMMNRSIVADSTGLSAGSRARIGDSPSRDRTRDSVSLVFFDTLLLKSSN